MKKKVLIGVTGGIAGFKALELISILKESGIEVFVAMTVHATQMFPVAEFEKLSGKKVFTQLFEDDFNYKSVLTSRKVDHIELADSVDVVVVVPATANFIAKAAHGIADDFLTTTLLATRAPIIVCPSMNVNMWNNPIVQKNIATLKEFNFQIIEPVSGMLACGYEGKGKLEDVQLIAKEILSALSLTT